jgi:hypothetical protein
MNSTSQDTNPEPNNHLVTNNSHQQEENRKTKTAEKNNKMKIKKELTSQ